MSIQSRADEGAEKTTLNETAAPSRKRIALVVHDTKKRDLIEWAEFNQDLLAQHELFATGTTGNLKGKSIF